MGEMIMHPCGGSWAYCDGDCCHCEKANLTTSNSTTITKTNADRIRSMTDEELAALLARETFRIAKPCFDAFGYGLEAQVIYAKRLDWLKQPYKEDAQ